MGNVCKICFNRSGARASNRKIVLMLVGLDNAGKTTVAKSLIGDRTDTPVPTVGFDILSHKYKGYTVTLYDLGGGPQIRGIWNKYFADVHGIIFVVDASDVGRLEEVRNVLESLLTNDKLCGKPILLLANKQDKAGALDELDIVEKLNLEVLVNQQRCPTLVETCSAKCKNWPRKKIDLAIYNGYRWILNCIITDFEQLNSRVEKDMAEALQIQDKVRQERLTRLENYLKERGEQTSDSEGSHLNGTIKNPFRPIIEVIHLQFMALFALSRTGGKATYNKCMSLWKVSLAMGTL